jgi:hypothetical protein
MPKELDMSFQREDGNEGVLVFLGVLTVSQFIAALLVQQEWFEHRWQYYAAIGAAGVMVWAILTGIIFITLRILKRGTR